MTRGKAQGLRGLSTGGRAGLAKRNLASMAPDFMRPASTANTKPVSKLSALAARSSAKRPAENPPATASRPRPASPAPSPAPAPATPVSTSAAPAVASSGRPSKLAALAAARSGANASTPKTAPAQTPETINATATNTAAGTAQKPLSKLQQRMLANKQQRSAATPEAKEAAAAEAPKKKLDRVQRLAMAPTCPSLPSFLATKQIQRTLGGEKTERVSHAALASVSSIAGSSVDATDQLVAPLAKLRMVPEARPLLCMCRAVRRRAQRRRSSRSRRRLLDQAPTMSC